MLWHETPFMHACNITTHIQKGCVKLLSLFFSPPPVACFLHAAEPVFLEENEGKAQPIAENRQKNN